MGRAIWWVVAVAVAVVAAILPAAAGAAEPLYAHGCVLASERPLSLGAAEADPRWTCDPRPADARARHLWLRFDGDILARGEAQRLEGDAMPFAGLQTVVRFADGSMRSRYFDDSAIAENWTSGTRFSLDLYRANEQPVALYIRIDRPFDRQVATGLQLESVALAHERKLRDMILFAVFTGMLIVVALYSFSLWIALRARFALWHLGMVMALLVFTVSSSSLVFLLVPGLHLWMRTSLSYVGLALSMAIMAPFLCEYLERRALTRALRRLAFASAALVGVAGVAVMLLGPQLPFVLRNLYHLAYVPGLAAFAAVCLGAWRRGSRAVRLVALAWSLPVLCAAERIARAVGQYELPVRTDFALFAAMAFQAIVMAFAIAWRIGEVRRERDLALEQGDALALMAQTDSLTGLPNRRAFDARHWRGGDFLAIIDVDRFKRINDGFGHATGDDVLRAIGAELSAAAADGRVRGAWRMGGEEFAVLVEAGAVAEAALAVNRLRGQVSAAIAAAHSHLPPVTLSAGLAPFGNRGLAATYEKADRALYRAKASGRDRLSWEAGDLGKATIFPRAGRRAA